MRKERKRIPFLLSKNDVYNSGLENGKVIAVANQKGGTTTVNLATALAYQGKKILLIDSMRKGMRRVV